MSRVAVGRPSHPRPRRLRDERGFTLVEAVVALGLFSIVLGSTGLVVVRALTGTGTTDRAVTAVMVADQALENARTISAQAGPGGTPPVGARRTAGPGRPGAPARPTLT